MKHNDNHRETVPARSIFDQGQAAGAPPVDAPSGEYREQRRATAQWYAELVARPFNDFLIQAWGYHRDMSGDERIWHSDLFWFVWLLRGHPSLNQFLASPKKAIDVVEGHLKSWTAHRRTKGEAPPFDFNPGDAWMDWFGIPKADAHAEFFDVWEKSRFTPGSDPLQQAAEANRRLRLRLSDEIRDRRPLGDNRCESDYEFFVGVAGHLQVLVGDQPIKLPCQNVAALMGVSKMTISRYRRWAENDGFIKTTRQHRYSSKGSGDATEFRFDVSRWRCLSDRSQVGTAESFAQGVENDDRKTAVVTPHGS